MGDVDIPEESTRLRRLRNLVDIAEDVEDVEGRRGWPEEEVWLKEEVEKWVEGDRYL